MLPNAETGSEEAVTTETVAASGICKQVQHLQPRRHQATQMTGPLPESEETRTGGGKIKTGIESQDQWQGESKTQQILYMKPRIQALTQDLRQSQTTNPSWL